MNEFEEPTLWEPAIAQLAREYPYPPTPDLTAVRSRPRQTKSTTMHDHRRTPAWAVGLAVIAVLLVGVMAVPRTRAAVLTFIGRIGGIRLFVDETLPPVPTLVPAPAIAPPSATTRPTPTPVPLALLSAAPGEPVDLGDLSERAGFPVWLPAQSSEWGTPDSAVLHDFANRSLVTIIWNDPIQPGRPVLTLSQSDIPELAYKMIGADQMTEVMVNGEKGMWIMGPHNLQLPIDGGSTGTYLASNVLIWSDPRMTFRIEGDISLDDALRLAESLSPGNSP